MVVIETDRLLLRQFEPDDADALDRIFTDPQVMLCGGVKSPEWVRQWLNSYLDTHYTRWGFGMWAVIEKTTNNLIGYCGLSRYPDRCANHEAEIGYRLARPHWHRGLATEAARATTTYAIDVLKRQRLIAIIDPENRASIHVAKKVGFQFEKEVMFEGYTHPDHLYALQAATA